MFRFRGLPEIALAQPQVVKILDFEVLQVSGFRLCKISTIDRPMTTHFLLLSDRPPASGRRAPSQN